MSRTEALAAYERLPIPDTTEEHLRFTNLSDFDARFPTIGAALPTI